MLNAIRAWITNLFVEAETPEVTEPHSDYVVEPSLTLYDVIEQAAIETADADVLLWEQSLRAKYGIPQPMEKA